MACMYGSKVQLRADENESRIHEGKCGLSGSISNLRPKKKDSCVQVSEVKKIRVGRSKNIFIWEFFFITNAQRFY